jgi:hypothetical protein
MKLKEGKYLYSFRDAYLAGKEESSMIIRSKKKENFDSRNYLSHRDVYGVIVFESDLDLPLGKVYKN